MVNPALHGGEIQQTLLKIQQTWLKIQQTLLTMQKIWLKPYIEERQTTKWSKEIGKKGKQRSTKHTHKTKDRVTRTLLKTGDELRYSRRASRSCSTEVNVWVLVARSLVFRVVFCTSLFVLLPFFSKTLHGKLKIEQHEPKHLS